MRRPGLRTRVVAALAGGALLLSAVMAFASYELTRRSLLSEREAIAVRTTYFDAAALESDPVEPVDQPDVVERLLALDTGDARQAAVRDNDQWYTRAADAGVPAVVPASLQALVRSGRPGMQRVATPTGPAVVVGLPLSATQQFYEVHPLNELNQTLGVLAASLAVVAAGTAAGGAGLGWYATRRILRPLASVTRAAQGIAGGDLTARLDAAADPELRPLTASFNDMVDRLSARIDRDRRFAADVSHELRSPLQTLAGAAGVLANRRDSLDERSAAAAELVSEEVTRFQRLVTDLLELARTDQAAEVSTVDMGALARQVCRSYDVRPSIVDSDGATTWTVDRRRMLQVLGNLVDNAERHGGGAVAIRLRTDAGGYVVEVDDDGPGVLPQDRAVVFDPFVRGGNARARGDSDGTGLGLTLVAQHVAAQGGRVIVADRPGGGARFRIELPGPST